MLLFDLLRDPTLRIPNDVPDLPDFVRPDYPFDLPPYRRAFFTRVFEAAGVPRACPAPECRRSGRCRGQDGPPCYRAERARLNRLLLRVYMACNYLDEVGCYEIARQLETELGGPPLRLPPDYLAPPLSPAEDQLRPGPRPKRSRRRP